MSAHHLPPRFDDFNCNFCVIRAVGHGGANNGHRRVEKPEGKCGVRSAKFGLADPEYSAIGEVLDTLEFARAAKRRFARRNGS